MTRNKMPEQRNYYSEINIMRGILAVLVVLGHVVTQLELTDSWEYKIFNILGKCIYSFHMPMFFVISGFVSVHILRYNTLEMKLNFIKKKFLRLMVPYFTMGGIYFPFKVLLNKISRTDYSVRDFWKILIGENPDGALWFLYALFLISVLICMISTENNFHLIMAVSLILYISSWIFSFPFILLKYLADYLFFYILGMYIRLHYDESLRNIKYSKKMPLMGMASCIVYIVGNILSCYYGIKITHIVTALSGTFLVWLISLVVVNKRESRINKYCNLLGEYAMDIYIFGEPIKVLVRTLLKNVRLTIMVPGVLLIVITSAVFLSKYVIRRSEKLRFLFLGKFTL